MNDGMVSVRVLLILLIAGLITYVAFHNPALGVALGVGVVVAAFIHQITQSDTENTENTKDGGGHGGNGGSGNTSVPNSTNSPSSPNSPTPTDR